MIALLVVLWKLWVTYCIVIGTWVTADWISGFRAERRRRSSVDRWPLPTDQRARDIWFAPGNNALWGEGNWVRCSVCPHDEAGCEVYHHKEFHRYDGRTS